MNRQSSPQRCFSASHICCWLRRQALPTYLSSWSTWVQPGRYDRGGTKNSLVEKMCVVDYYFISLLFLAEFAKGWIEQHFNEDTCFY